jgi:hypothetical protein
MPELGPEQNQIIAWLPLAQVTGQMPEIQPREELRRFLAPRVIVPTACPGRSTAPAAVKGMIYQLHNVR